MNRNIMGMAGLGIAFVSLVSINMVANATLKGARLDLTEGKLYTLTDGTRNIVANLVEPVTLRFYFSEKATNNIPQLATYGKRVRELLEEYVRAADGNLRLEVIDPEPFTEEEDAAVAAGLQGVPLTAETSVYFGLEGVNTVDGRETIPFFDPRREPNLEYDVSQLIYRLGNPEKPQVSIISSLPISGSDPMDRMMNRRNTQDPWTIYEVLQQNYDVELLQDETETIPEGTDVLMLVHPKELSEATRYAIDQYIMGGGKAMIFVDPHAEVETPPENPQNPMASMFAPRSSELPEIFAALGVELVGQQIAADRQRAQTVTFNSQRGPQQVNYVAYMALRGEDINSDEVAAAELENLNLQTAGVLKPLEEATTQFIPVLETTEDSQQISVTTVQSFPDPAKMYNEFESSGKKQVLAARITGPASTAFPEGIANEDGEKELPENHRAESEGDVNVLVVADVDMLSDGAWVRRMQFFNQFITQPFAGNGSLVLNYMDFYAGSDDLISIRSRGVTQRPFTKVEELEKQAADRFAEKVAELEEELQQTEQKISELQRARSDQASASSRLFLTEEQQAELERFREQQVETRKELRRVKAALNEDIESLGSRLKLINVGLLPLMVGLVAVSLGVARQRRRRRR